MLDGAMNLLSYAEKDQWNTPTFSSREDYPLLQGMKFAYYAGFMYDDMRKKFHINMFQIKKAESDIIS